MGRFNNSRDSYRKPSGGGRSGGNRDRQTLTTYSAVCDECGKDCRIPFRPTPGKPIYCSDCFEKKGGNNRERSGGMKFRGDFNDRGMFKAICDDCGNDCEVPFRPNSDKPIYCSRCFEKRGNGNEDRGNYRGGDRGRSRGGYRGNDRGGNGQSEELKAINEKLDRLLKLLEGK